MRTQLHFERFKCESRLHFWTFFLLITYVSSDSITLFCASVCKILSREHHYYGNEKVSQEPLSLQKNQDMMQIHYV